MAATM